MTPEVLSRIDSIAAALGVSAQYLWHALVRQGTLEGIYGLVTVVLAGGLAGYMARRALRHHCDYSNCAFCQGGIIGAWLAVAVLVLVALLSLDQTKYLFNAEGFAAEKVLEAMTPKVSK